MAERKFFGEIGALVEKHVKVVTSDGKVFTGVLAGINPNTLSLVLSEAKDDKGVPSHRVFLSGNVVAQVLAIEKPFDLKALADRLEKVFPTMVKLYEDKGFVWVMEKVKVTEQGVVTGTGPAAERVQNVYEKFLSETKA